MIAPQTYVLDANAFIEAKRRYYAFDLCPGFWDALVWHQGQGAVGSIDRVKGELQLGADDLTQWVDTVMPPVCFDSTTNPDVIQRFTDMMHWVQANAQFSPAAKAECAASCDPWLVAYAKVTGRVLVTHERLAPDAQRRVPIPNICVAFQVSYMDTFEMLRSLHAQFTWSP
jgi:hypothetical protein